MNIDRFLQCLRRDKDMPDGTIIPGHNFTPNQAYVEDGTLHLPHYCKWCLFRIETTKPYENETREQIRELYGFELDDSSEAV